VLWLLGSTIQARWDVALPVHGVAFQMSRCIHSEADFEARTTVKQRERSQRAASSTPVFDLDRSIGHLKAADAGNSIKVEPIRVLVNGMAQGVTTTRFTAASSGCRRGMSNAPLSTAVGAHDDLQRRDRTLSHQQYDTARAVHHARETSPFDMMSIEDLIPPTNPPTSCTPSISLGEW
jgi:hypothetical protein